MHRYFLTLSYNGTVYNGWQIQKNTANTVQQIMEEKMSMVLKEKIHLMGCGRTDTGVNARDFVAHFDTEKELLPNAFALLRQLNQVLPPSIGVHKLEEVHQKAHARFSAYERLYYYYITLDKNPFRSQFTWRLYQKPDFDKMNEVAKVLLGTHDFAAFSKSHTQVNTTICTITEARWVQCGENEWRFSIRANRFLRGMVRAVVGTLLLVGQHRLTEAEFIAIIQSKDRKQAGSNSPPQALFLTGIRYPKEIYL